MGRCGFLLFLSLASLFCQPPKALAQTVVYHVFEFDQKAGYYREDTDTVGQRLFEQGAVQGDVTLTDCRKSSEWGSGFRVSVRTADDTQKVLVGVSCSPDGQSILAGHLVIEGVDDNAIVKGGQSYGQIALAGQTIPFELTLREREADMVIAGLTITVPLGFEPEEAVFFAFGTQGVARFYEIVDVSG